MKKPLLIALASILSLTLVFLGIRMATAPTELTPVQTYAFPTFTDLDSIIVPHGDIKQAIAIDGQLAYTDHSPAQPTASTAKMITALMVMEQQPFGLGETGGTLEITQEFYDQYLWYVANGGSNAAVAVGERISEYDALAAAFLPSSNNFADALAIWAFGSLDAYRDYATARLTAWGLDDTTIGLDASGFSETTTSTAADLALIGQKVMANPVLAEIAGLTSHTIPVAGQIDNTNQLLGKHGIVGVKTGYIGDPSGYCLVSAYRLGGHIITLAILDAPTRADSFSVSESIISTLQQSLTESTIIHQGDEIGYYDSWWTGRTPITADTDLTVLGWQNAHTSSELIMDDVSGSLNLNLNSESHQVPVTAHGLNLQPTIWQRFLYALGLL